MKKRFFSSCLVFVVLIFLAVSAVAQSLFVYEQQKVTHPGKEAAPLEAYALIQQDQAHMIIVDVRTRPEYQLVGHPPTAFLVPLLFWSAEYKNNEYQLVENPNFGKDIMSRFDPKTDTLFFLCRSGHRASVALNNAVAAGWPAGKAYVILGGFEGEKMKDKNSAYAGQRIGGGWRNEGLPWTYAMDQKLVY